MDRRTAQRNLTAGLLAAGLALFVLTSAACALAPDVNWLIASRAVQGAGAALVISLALAIVSAAFEPSAEARRSGSWRASPAWPPSPAP